ncbi:UNVERIFIED_CONTAM: hypothetical protein ABIC26_000126 [Paenibacillus sp. PvR008]
MNKQEARELTAEQINTLDNWVDTISYTVMVLLEGVRSKKLSVSTEKRYPEMTSRKIPESPPQERRMLYHLIGVICVPAYFIMSSFGLFQNEKVLVQYIIHQIRNSTRYVSYKDLKKVTADLKPIYKAITEEAALAEWDRFEEAWGTKYPLIVQSWRKNWDELATFFKYPPELRKLIYTTNIIESYHRQLRKVTKGKSIFPSDEALLKMLYLATMDVVRKWTGRVQNWGQMLLQLSIFFPDRVGQHLREGVFPHW